jgi:hypothetical protein
VKRYVFRYPGDPPVEVLETSRDEFLALFPRTPMRIGTLTDSGEMADVEEFPMAPDEIRCDLCGAKYDDPTGMEPIFVYNRSRTKCDKCWRESGYQEKCTLAREQRLDRPLR